VTVCEESPPPARKARSSTFGDMSFADFMHGINDRGSYYGSDGGYGSPLASGIYSDIWRPCELCG